jgi:hypothetical protein
MPEQEKDYISWKFMMCIEQITKGRLTCQGTEVLRFLHRLFIQLRSRDEKCLQNFGEET